MVFQACSFEPDEAAEEVPHLGAPDDDLMAIPLLVPLDAGRDLHRAHCGHL